jgi:hypothetical protein
LLFAEPVLGLHLPVRKADTGQLREVYRKPDHDEEGQDHIVTKMHSRQVPLFREGYIKRHTTDELIEAARGVK